MLFLYGLTAVSMLLSLIISRKKTLKAFKTGMKKLWNITPSFISVLMGVSVVLYLVPREFIASALGGSGSFPGIMAASLIGSITVMPGPIVYPLCRILVNGGVAYSVIAAFSTTLMMVGIVTFPMEKTYFGWKFAFVRNLISYFTGLVIALIFLVFQGSLP